MTAGRPEAHADETSLTRDTSIVHTVPGRVTAPYNGRTVDRGHCTLRFEVMTCAGDQVEGPKVTAGDDRDHLEPSTSYEARS
jgi:hypothetical protein